MTYSSLRCAMLTPTGRGAIAVIALWGDSLSLAETILESLFESSSGKKLSQIIGNGIWYGRWRPTLEDVIIVRLHDRFEIHCHGGKVAPMSILKSFGEKRVEEVSTNEAIAYFEKSPWLAELTAAMTRATTERTASALLSQYHQAPMLIAELHELVRAGESNSVDLISRLNQILSWERYGRHLTIPWSVVLCGRPNVGKSSLINALVGFDRAIVHETAGTTRDVVTQVTAVEGWPIELKDTAGLRETEDTIEKQGVAFSREEIEQADLVIAVFDASQLEPVTNWELVEAVKASIVVVNKTDLVNDPKVLDRWNSTKPVPCECLIQLTSTTAKKGIEELIRAIALQLVPLEPPPDILVPATAIQTELIQQLRELIERRHWKAALEALGNW